MRNCATSDFCHLTSVIGHLASDLVETASPVSLFTTHHSQLLANPPPAPWPPWRLKRLTSGRSSCHRGRPPRPDRLRPWLPAASRKLSAHLPRPIDNRARESGMSFCSSRGFHSHGVAGVDRRLPLRPGTRALALPFVFVSPRVHGACNALLTGVWRNVRWRWCSSLQVATGSCAPCVARRGATDFLSPHRPQQSGSARFRGAVRGRFP